MAFRADEAAQAGFDGVVSYLIPRARNLEESDRARSRQALNEIVERCGPVVDSYPSWHPLVCHHDDHQPETTPSKQCGYQGLDHTVYFANGFITCPYGDGQEVLNSVAALPRHEIAQITAEKLDVHLYAENAVPILVECHWHKSLETDGTIPLSIALALILEKEVPCWKWSRVAETWETMRPYFLGGPHGSRSSLFINQEAGQAIKKIWETLIHTGIFGPIRVR
jgi:hypothetical protein